LQNKQGDTAVERPRITYFISHAHARTKKNAIATLGEIMRRLGYDFPIADCRRVLMGADIQILLSGKVMRATINIYDPKAQPIASEDELPHLDVTFNG
jgi:hypothetical protein